jgi:putative endonuclease
MLSRLPNINSIAENRSQLPYYVYVIKCDDNSFYTGYTKNPDSRFKLHVKGKGARYTRMHRPKKLVYQEKFGTRSEAMKREKRIKRLTHGQKLKMMDSHAATGKRDRNAKRRHRGV